jgi:hypothetical protein
VTFYSNTVASYAPAEGTNYMDCGGTTSSGTFSVYTDDFGWSLSSWDLWCPAGDAYDSVWEATLQRPETGSCASLGTIHAEFSTSS